MNDPQPGAMRRSDYIARINRVIDHIAAHLDEELKLEPLARVADFSPFHFHRIFRALTGEPLGQYILRLRLERAAARLIGTPREPITEIALDCGFSGSAAFARAFREAFGMSAGEWRRKKCKIPGNPDELRGNLRKDWTVAFRYTGDGKFYWRLHMKQNDMTVNVEVKEMPEWTVAYVRHIGPYKRNSALFERLFTQLMSWAAPRGLLRFPETKSIAVYHDDPAITDESKLRMSCCLTVPADTKVEGEIGRMVLPGGPYAVGHFELAMDEYEQAWNALYAGWLPESGYECADSPCYELYLNNPDEHPQKKCVVDICIPLKPR